MPESFVPADCIAPVADQPPRIAPMDETRIGERGMELLDTLHALYSADGPHEVHSTFLTLFKHHDAAQAYLELGVLFTTNPALAPRDKELAILRTAWLCRSPIAWGEHVAAGRDAGLGDEDIERLTQGSSAPGWADDDRAIVSAAEELHFAAMISDETWAALAARLDEHQLIELPMLIGHYHTTAFLQNALRFAPRVGNRGLAER